MVEIIGLLAGGGTGLIGSLVNRFAGFFEAKQKLKEKVIDYKHEKDLLAMQQAERSKDREHESDMLESVEDTKALGISFQHDTGYGDSILRFVRPLITLMLIGLVFTIYLTTTETGIQTQIITQVLFLTSMAVGWWFGDRSGKSKDKK